MTQLVLHTQKMNERRKFSTPWTPINEHWKKKSETNVTDGRIFFKNKLFVPNVGQLKLRLIKKSHDDPVAGHPGKTKTYEIFNRYYYWPRIINDVKRFIQNCYGCRRSKNFRDKYLGALKPFPVPDKGWSHISIDFIVDLPVNRDLWGRKYINIMVIIDKLSKMVKCIFMDGITVKNAAKAFYTHIWKNHGLFSFIIFYRGPNVRKLFLGPINHETRDKNRLFHGLPPRNRWANGNFELHSRTIPKSLCEFFTKRLGFLATFNRICY